MKIDDIDGYIEDMISNFLYYDRKEDCQLPVGAIEEAVKSGELTIDEMVECFRKHLTEGVG